MTEKQTEQLQLLSSLLFKCWVMGFAILVIWLAFVLFGRQLIDTAHGLMFGLSDHELDVIMYCAMGIWKFLVLIFYFLPWLAIRWTLKSNVS